MGPKEYEIFANTLIDKKKFLSNGAKKLAKKRIKDISEILTALSNYNFELQNDIDHPRLEFLGSVERYLCGFYEDSINCSILSVEIGLLVKLNQIIPDGEKQFIHQEINKKEGKPLSFTFGYMKDLALSKKYNIIRGDKNKEIIEKLVIKRNSHLHIITYLSAIINILKERLLDNYLGYDKNINIIKKHKYVSKLIKINKIEGIVDKKKNIVKELSTFSWCSTDKNKNFIENLINVYMNEMESKIKTTMKQLKENPTKITTLKKFIKEITEDTFPKRFALQTLNESYTILDAIDII